MPRLCLITVPGLHVSSDWRPVHDRLLETFPEVTDVLATTMKETILVVYQGAAPDDASRWLDVVSETLLRRRQSGGAHVRPGKRAVDRSEPGRPSTGLRSLESLK